MRGKVEAAILAMERNGITPACAGKSNQITPVSRRGEDHPRVCGEKRQIWYKMLCCGGSPPRVRGKGALSGGRAHLPWITPACAGKRPRLPFFDIFGGDHPRVCGEKARCTAGIFPVSGSPSRVRGKENVDTYKRRHSRITPACAGKRQLALVTNVPNRDHPRVCGEKSTARGSVKYILGSPPRVRGKVALFAVIGHHVGITPACAGKSPCSYQAQALPRDHPRVCGEKAAAGSSQGC